MPKRGVGKEKSAPSKKSPRLSHDQGPSPTDPPTDLPIDPPTTDPPTDLPSDLPNDLPKDHPTGLSEKQAKDPSTTSSEKTGVELSTDTSKDLFKDSTTGSSALRDLLVESKPSTNPFKHPSADIVSKDFKQLDIKGFSVTPENASKVNGRVSTFREFVYPDVYDIKCLVCNYLGVVHLFSQEMVDLSYQKPVDDDEINRVQRLFDEFGQVDPDFPPRLVVDRLVDRHLRAAAIERIINWALITNIAVDGDINYTLLPHRVLACYRELDRDGSDAHRALFSRWIELTFVLLAGGHDAYQVSAETLQRTDRIRQFLIKLLGPYCAKHRDEPIFLEGLDLVLQWAVATGYHLMGVAERYRWDWTWQKPVREDLGLVILGKPPPRRPREEEVPKGMWVTAPALVKETDHLGNQLEIEITFRNIEQSGLVPTTFIDPTFVIDQAELDRMKASIYPKFAKKLEREKAEKEKKEKAEKARVKDG